MHEQTTVFMLLDYHVSESGLTREREFGVRSREKPDFSVLA